MELPGWQEDAAAESEAEELAMAELQNKDDGRDVEPLNL